MASSYKTRSPSPLKNPQGKAFKIVSIKLTLFTANRSIRMYYSFDSNILINISMLQLTVKHSTRMMRGGGISCKILRMSMSQFVSREEAYKVCFSADMQLL